MKKYLKFLLIGVLFIITACTEVLIIYPPYRYGTNTNNGAILFNNYSSATKAMAGEGPNGVGYGNFTVYGWKDDSVIMDPYQVTWTNNEWTYEGINSQELKYYNRSAQQYSFIGIISDKTPVRNGDIIDVEKVEAFQTNDEMNSPKEFLYAKTVIPSENFGQYVNMTFNHANSRMFIGFASDRSDTKVIDYVPDQPAVPAHNDTLGVYFNVKKTTNLILTASNYSSTNSIPQALIDEIKSYYSIDNGAAGSYDIKSMDSGVHTLKVVKDIPAAYKKSFVMGGEKAFEFFDGFKYLADNGYNLTLNKPEVSGYILLEGYINGSAYTIAGFDYGLTAGTTNSKPNYEVVETPAQPAVAGLPGIRVFSVDDSGNPIVHKVHTDTADLHLGIVHALSFDNIVANSNVINFDEPSVVIAQSDDTNITWAEATPSPTIRYALPVENTGYVVKFSYTYNGVNYYDARVLIPTVNANFLASKNYTYVIYITDKTNGTTDPTEAIDDKDEVDTTQKAIVFSQISFADYGDGDHYVYSVL